MAKHTDKKNTPRVYMALSGGVDSAVSAYLLQKQGYDVTGAFIKTWKPPFLECNIPQDHNDARNVASYLSIPFTTVDLEDTYKNEVVDYMIEEYANGRTPNPDVMCNRSVKFGAFLRIAQERGADYIATGHYAHNTGTALYEGVDKQKDQSYFLWKLTQQQLQKSLFPLGQFHKTETRTLAQDINLPVATKKDSQGVCFMGKLDMKNFLSQFITTEPGRVIDVHGSIIGQHEGAVLYTLGQRHGFTIQRKGAYDGPYYVLEKDITTNTIVVGPKIEKRHYAVNRITLNQTNWISAPPAIDTLYTARYRYRQTPQTCYVEDINESIDKAVIRFTHPQESVSPGQSFVIYNNNHCIGGGVINATERI